MKCCQLWNKFVTDGIFIYKLFNFFQNNLHHRKPLSDHTIIWYNQFITNDVWRDDYGKSM